MSNDTTWDVIVVRLHEIEDRASAIDRHARGICGLMDRLTLRPKWETKAGAGLDEAAAILRKALAQVERAQAAYRDKPLMLEAAE